MIRTAAILVSVHLVSSVAWAADDAGTFVAYGLGNRPCSEWTESRARDDAETIRMTTWTLGFISAYNKYVHKGINVAGGLEASEIHSAIDRHCEARPFDSLAFATNALIERLSQAEGSSGIGRLLDLWPFPKR